jgi:hypothetical protein
MTKKKDTENMRELDCLFEAARSETTTPSDALMAAILRDASAKMPQPAHISSRTHSEPTRPSGVLRSLFAGLGGWQAVTALTASACFGLWIGYAMPEQAALVGMDTVAAGELTDDDYAFYSDIDDLLAEG